MSKVVKWEVTHVNGWAVTTSTFSKEFIARQYYAEKARKYGEAYLTKVTTETIIEVVECTDDPRRCDSSLQAIQKGRVQDQEEND